jgi:autoinducer 2-degrading protein
MDAALVNQEAQFLEARPGRNAAARPARTDLGLLSGAGGGVGSAGLSAERGELFDRVGHRSGGFARPGKRALVMGAFVISVEFTVDHDRVDQFLVLIAENARHSLEEPGCRQFDVTRSLAEPDRILLYEVYDDVAAFEAHQKTPHFASFFKAAEGFIKDRVLGRYDRVFP